MKTLKLSDDLILPADDAVVRQFAWLGRTGSGKSFGAGRLVEEIIGAKHQVVILDWIGIWWALRLAADGKSPGLDVRVFGGLHGDVPLEPGSGALVAQVAVDRGISMVLDLSLFRKNARRQFGMEFAEELFERKKRSRSPMHLVIEECQEFVPQYAEPQERRMLGAYEDLGKIGRNYGIGWSAISQRPQAVSKELLSQADPLMVFQTSGAHERKAIRQWVDEKGLEADALFERILKLPVGRCCFWSPQWLGKFLEIGILPKRTFNASATPKRGERAVEPRPLSADDLKQLTIDMQAVVDRAKATDPKIMLARIAQLERELRDRPHVTKVATAVNVEPKIVKVPVVAPIRPAQLRALERILKGYDRQNDRLAHTNQLLQMHWQSFGQTAESMRDALWPPAPPPPRAMIKGGREVQVGGAAPRLPSSIQRVHSGKLVVDGEGNIGAGPRRMLEVLAAFPFNILTKNQLGVLSIYPATGSTFRTYVPILKRAGLVQEDPVGLMATEAGRKLVGAQAPPTADEVLAAWRIRLGAGEAKMLNVLVDAHPQRVTREALGEHAGYEYTGSTFRTYLPKLRRKGLVQYDASEAWMNADVYFGAGA